MLLVGLDIATKLEAAVFMIVKIIASHQGMGTHHIGDSIMGRKHIEPKNTWVNHFLEHQYREAAEWNQVVEAMSLLLYCSDEALHLGDMFIIRTDIEPRPSGSKWGMQRLKFAVSMHHMHKKTTGAI